MTGVVAFALVVSGCGGRERAGGDPPKEDPARAMIRLVEHEFAGRLDRSYAMLVRGQRQAVNRKLYVRCPPGPPTTNVRDRVVGVHDVLFDVPALGKIETKAVSYRLSVAGADENPISISGKGHLIAQDGEWRWTLSRGSFSALLTGACP